jgi:hypothetical protein
VFENGIDPLIGDVTLNICERIAQRWRVEREESQQTIVANVV